MAVSHSSPLDRERRGSLEGRAALRIRAGKSRGAASVPEAARDRSLVLGRLTTICSTAASAMRRTAAVRGRKSIGVIRTRFGRESKGFAGVRSAVHSRQGAWPFFDERSLHTGGAAGSIAVPRTFKPLKIFVPCDGLKRRPRASQRKAARERDRTTRARRRPRAFSESEVLKMAVGETSPWVLIPPFRQINGLRRYPRQYMAQRAGTEAVRFDARAGTFCPGVSVASGRCLSFWSGSTLFFRNSKVKDAKRAHAVRQYARPLGKYG
jgi:hypothetical protein